MNTVIPDKETITHLLAKDIRKFGFETVNVAAKEVQREWGITINQIGSSEYIRFANAVRDKLHA